MKRILFLIIYAIGLSYMWPGLVMGRCSEYCPFPPLWLNVLILPGSILVFAAAIFVAWRLFRFRGFDKPQPDGDWSKSRPGTNQVPGELPPVPPAKTTPLCSHQVSRTPHLQPLPIQVAGVAKMI